MSHIIKRLYFEASVPRKDRVKALAPVLNKALADFENDKINIGVEAFDVEVVAVIEAAGLLDKAHFFLPTRWAPTLTTETSRWQCQ